MPAETVVDGAAPGKCVFGARIVADDSVLGDCLDVLSIVADGSPPFDCMPGAETVVDGSLFGDCVDVPSIVALSLLFNDCPLVAGCS